MTGSEQDLFEILSNVGAAKSEYMKAIQSVKKQNFSEVESLFKTGDGYLLAAHKVHTKMIQEEAGGSEPKISLLLVHVEDQLMGCESIKIMAKEFIHVYAQLQDLKKEQTVILNKIT